MKRSVIGYISILTVLLSCQMNEKFDKVRWQTWEDPAFPPSARNNMLKDLLTNYQWDQMKKDQVLTLLGKPDFISDSNFVYRVVEYYGFDIDPVYTKDFEIKLNPDQSVRETRIKEWKR